MPILFFDDAPYRTWPHRAQQIWQILVSCAVQKKLVTYGEVAKYLGFKGAGVLAHPLGHIMNYCLAHELPPLTALVINQETGAPGAGLTALQSYGSLDLARIAVFDYEWYKVIPPTIEEFEIVGDGW